MVNITNASDEFESSFKLSVMFTILKQHDTQKTLQWIQNALKTPTVKKDSCIQIIQIIITVTTTTTWF